MTEIKLIGTILRDNLKWGKNTKFHVKSAYATIELLQQVSNFTSSVRDKIHNYKTYIRSGLEQELNVDTLKKKRNIKVQIFRKLYYKSKDKIHI